LDPVNLDEHRSTEELLTLRKDLSERMAELNTEFTGRPMEAAARDEFAGIAKTIDDLDKRVKEFEARKKMIERYGDEPARVEKVDDGFFRDGRPSVKDATSTTCRTSG
jgi:hypothetical protein